MTGVPVESVPDCVRRILDTICAELNFKTYRLRFERGSNDGDGIIGVLTRVYVEGERNCSPDRISLICKYQPSDKGLRDKYNTAQLFAREVYVYTHVLPEFEKLQAEYGISRNDGYFAFPKCYHASGELDQDEDFILILEDLVARNFIMDPTIEVYQQEFAKLVYTQLGRLHALSYALRTHKPDVFEKFKQMDDLLHAVMLNDVLAPISKKSVELSAAILRPDEENLKRKVLRYKNSLWQKMAENVLNGRRIEPYSVINHADCWLNNLMCRYENGVPTELILIDYQHTRYCSPAIDLINFTFSRSAHEIRTINFQYFIDLYYESLQKLLRQFGCDADNMLPYDELQRHIKRFGLIGFALATFTIPANCGLDINNLPPTNSTSYQEFKFQMGRLIRDSNNLGFFGELRTACE